MLRASETFQLLDVTQQPIVAYSQPPAISLQPMSLQFAVKDTASAEASHVVIVKNTGGSALLVRSISLQDVDDSGDWLQLSAETMSISAHSTEPLTVRLDESALPSSDGTYFKVR